MIITSLFCYNLTLFGKFNLAFVNFYPKTCMYLNLILFKFIKNYYLMTFTCFSRLNKF